MQLIWIWIHSRLSLVFMMAMEVLTEYILVSVTSAATVTIAGVVREAVTILFTWLKGVGLTTILFGVSLFNWYKCTQMFPACCLHQSAHTPSHLDLSYFWILHGLN